MSSSSSSCADVAAEFAVAAQKVLDGIDHITDSPNIWACVQEGSDAAGRNNTGVLVKVTDGDPDCMELEVADSTKAEASLGSSFSEGGNEFIEVIIKGKQSTESTNPDDPASGVTLKAKNKDSEEVLADNCKIMVLPLRVVTFSNYPWRNPSAGSNEFNDSIPTGDELQSTLRNIFLRQGAVRFDKNESDTTVEVDYDDYKKYGALTVRPVSVNPNIDEAKAHIGDKAWKGTLAAFWFANSDYCTIEDGISCPPPNCDDHDTRIRGFVVSVDVSPPSGFIEANDAGSLKLLGMAHEFGHLGDIAGGGHYTGSSPSNVLPLMRPGFDEDCNYQDIGKWLTKDHWKNFNNGMKQYEQ